MNPPGILLYYVGSDIEPLERLLNAGIKIGLLNSAKQIGELGLFSIKYDEDEAINQIVSKFVSLGHRRIAIVMDSGWNASHHDHYAHQIQSLFIKHGLGTAKNMMVYPVWDPDIGERDCSALGKVFDVDAPPTAIIVPDESFAQGVLHFCYTRGIDIPGNISIATPQNLTPHAHAIPVSSPDTVSLWKYGIDRVAKYVMQLVEGEEPLEREVSLRCDVNWTESVGPVSQKFGTMATSSTG